jgi:hypothetical protein
MFFVKGKNVMTTKTFDGQTARFLAAVATCMPSLQGDVMQGWIDNPNALKKVLAGALCPPQVEEPKVYLQQLYVGEKIIIGPTDGTEMIAQAKDVFSYGVDADFKNWSLDVPTRPTEKAEVVVHELVKDGSFKEIYGRSAAELCLTQAQIIGFCRKHKDKLRQDGRHGTFFLFERDGKFFVAAVFVVSDGCLDAKVHRFSSGDVWSAEYRHRFVLPQLKPLVA